jgi:hypothetical protein
MHPLFQKYFEILLEKFQYDMDVMSQPWMIYTIVPIIGYLVFFLIKWAVLTAPIWMPFAIVVSSARARKSSPRGLNKKN